MFFEALHERALLDKFLVANAHITENDSVLHKLFLTDNHRVADAFSLGIPELSGERVASEVVHDWDASEAELINQH